MMEVHVRWMVCISGVWWVVAMDVCSMRVQDMRRSNSEMDFILGIYSDGTDFFLTCKSAVCRINECVFVDLMAKTSELVLIEGRVNALLHVHHIFLDSASDAGRVTQVITIENVEALLEEHGVSYKTIDTPKSVKLLKSNQKFISFLIFPTQRDKRSYIDVEEQMLQVEGYSQSNYSRKTSIDDTRHLYNLLYQYHAIPKMSANECASAACKNVNRAHGNKFTLSISSVSLIDLNGFYRSIYLNGDAGTHTLAYFRTKGDVMHIVATVNLPSAAELFTESKTYEDDNVKNIDWLTSFLDRIVSTHPRFWK